jgi:glycosyltransferase involved in cell wall biosynthesis
LTVSAVIPCYRCAGTVRRAALSVAAQTERPLELILVDDASDDATAQTLAELRTELGPHWVRVITLERNGGAAVARNAGWKAARGAYVAFLDADDTWLPSKIERQCAFMEAHPRFALTGHLDYGVNAGPYFGAAAEYRVLSRRWVMLRNPFVTPSFMVRRSVPVRFSEDRRHMEDHRFVQELVFKGMPVARIESRLAVVHKPSVGHSGLSSKLWRMELADLRNYADLRRDGHIRFWTYCLLLSYSLLKFARRAIVAQLRYLFFAMLRRS